MVQNLVLTYVVVAVLVIVGLGAYWAHRGRWRPTLNHRLAIVGVGLSWPVALPLALLVFLVALVAHVSTTTQNRAGRP